MKVNLVVFLFGFADFFLSFHCISLGLISPIEVVEEWGCHDTEIRLTCGHLDSKLAILEATFTPNCTETHCLQLDMKRLARVFSTPKRIDSRLAEAEAGRKFLETLRKTNVGDEDVDTDAGDDDEGDNNGESNVESFGGSPRADRLVDHKKTRTSLKASLERLIIRYLRKLSPSDDLDYNVKRSVRSRRNLPGVSSVSERIVIGERNITLNESAINREDVIEETYRRVQKSRSVCTEQKRKVSSLDRFDIDQSYRNESEDEYNIRKILNRRCSGRNHCSFLFALDHPFSKVWDSGVVRVKYICMEDFRTNQYCNEHLTIGYEVTADIYWPEIEPTKGEPLAEARVQPQHQSYHSLKILKTSDDVEIIPQIHSASRKRKIKLQTAKMEESGKENTGVYSQDFKVLKILPSNLDDFNDIEKIGDEIYFRTNDEILNAPEPTTSSEPRLTTRQVIYSEPESTDVLPSVQSTDAYLKSAEDYTKLSKNLSTFENITLTIREGEQYIIMFPTSKILDNISVNISATTSHPASNSSISNVLPSAKTTHQTSTLTVQEQDEMLITAQSEAADVRHQISPTADDLSAETTDKYEGLSSEGENRFVELPDNFDDYDSDMDKDESDRKTYSSIQRTFYGKPLLHGFAMSPGYPKFYIGDYNCKWMISAPIGQKIRLTVLDLSLRFDCKDFVEVIDLEIGRSLYNSCSESNRPVEVISDSSKLEVIMKSTTKFAYPKRGILLHYSALGCVNPPPPRNGRLVNRTESTAFYECELSFVFPDTGVRSRQLICTERHVWDKILPDCVEKLAIFGSGFVSSFNLGSRKKTTDNTAKTTEMSNKDADLVYDIIIPAVIISGLFIINAIIFVIILRFRQRNKSLEAESVELAEL